ncbi:MAG: hypothetical protein Q4F23_06560 [Coriobacteriia bacterium]|nr:hypothetical protein [Coriobacteriia bacterium]
MYKGRIPFSKKVMSRITGVAVLSSQGNRVTALVSSPGRLRKVSLDITKRKQVKSSSAIKGYSRCSQDISVWKSGGSTYLFGSGGGWTSATSGVVKYRLSGSRLSRIWTKRISGECEAVLPASGALYLVVEGSSTYNRNQVRITENMMNLLRPIG